MPETYEATLDSQRITQCLSALKQRYTPDAKGLLSYVSKLLPTAEELQVGFRWLPDDDQVASVLAGLLATP